MNKKTVWLGFINVSTSRLKMEGQPKCHNMFLQYHWKNKKVPFNDGKTTMHYGQTTDESVCCQIFPGMLKVRSQCTVLYAMTIKPHSLLHSGLKREW